MSKFWLVLFVSLGAFIGECKAGDEIDVNLFHQHDYEVKFERLEVLSYNKSLIDVKVITFKYNRTTAVANVTFTPNIYFGNDLVAVIQVYKFMSNEYRYFPIRFAINACRAYNANVGGLQEFLKCGNFTGCPLMKGIKRHICNWWPDQSQLPPLVPDGQYKTEVELSHLSQEVVIFNAYTTVSRPIVYGNDTHRPRKG